LQLVVLEFLEFIVVVTKAAATKPFSILCEDIGLCYKYIAWKFQVAPPNTKYALWP